MSHAADEHAFTARLASSLDGYHEFVEQVLAKLAECGWSGGDVFAVHMALEESISNAIRHGNKHDPRKQVEVECVASPNRFWARICDEGPGFRPESVPDCRCDDRLEIPGGRGLTLIKAYMTSVEYNDAGNCVTMEKRRAE
jgi:serine/threonine-protein kinase RsbW